MIKLSKKVAERAWLDGKTVWICKKGTKESHFNDPQFQTRETNRGNWIKPWNYFPSICRGMYQSYKALTFFVLE